MYKNLNKISLFFAVTTVAGASLGELIFNEDFDQTQDWTISSNKFPANWDVFRDGESNYGLADGNRDSLEILDIHSDKAKGGTGKSLVAFRESYTPESGWARWNSDGILAKTFPQGYDQLYVEFWIMFGENFVTVGGGMSKIFRISHNTNFDQPWQNGVGGANGPAVFWDYNVNDYGLRNTIALRGDPVENEAGESYYYVYAEDATRNASRTGYSFNLTENLVGQGGNGENPVLPDQLNGGDLPTTGIVSHEQVFGKHGTWNKLAFFVKMNSSPFIADGQLKQWINGEQILDLNKIAWHRENPGLDNTPKWNLVAFGGNDLFQTYPNEMKFEDWYSIDDIKIYTEIPNTPMPPQNFSNMN